MAEQNRQTSRKSAPISRHPLFPAIVALWFGALFGLGSLAVRPSLLEELVLAGQIDTLIPATAPPLGLTARILLALTMALIGGIIGATIARRIARPKPEVRQRRRGTQQPAASARSYANVAVEQADDDDDLDDDLAAVMPQKRRSLAMSEEETPLELREFAPLPGGGLQILNLVDVDAEPIRETAPQRSFAAPSAMVDDAFGEPAHAEEPAARMPEPAPPHEAMARLRQTFGAPVEDRANDLAIEPTATARRFDQSGMAASDAVTASPNPLVQPRPFAQPPGVAPSFAPPAPPATATSIDATEDRPADVATTRDPIALAPHVPLFREPEPEPEPEAEAKPETAAPEPLAASAPAPSSASAPATGFALPKGAAARQLVGAELDALSPVQLVERLALSIQRRRERIVAEPVTEAAAPNLVSKTAAPFAEPTPAKPAFAAPAHFAPAPLAPAPLAPPPAATAPFAKPPVATVTVPPAPVEPAIVPPPMAMPAALRPVSTFDDDDTDFEELALPARFVAAPVAPEPVASTEVSEAEAQPDEPDEETRVLADGYSSLLDLSRPAGQRAQFVRIEEPDEPSGPIEPVVVFPGQSARAAAAPAPDAARAAPFAPPPPRLAAQNPEPVQPGRRFDSPPAGATGMQPAAERDSEEAERALRAALATLQRMSAAS